MNTRPPESEPLLTPAEVAAMFRVDPKTVTRWAKAGKLARSGLSEDIAVIASPKCVTC